MTLFILILSVLFIGSTPPCLSQDCFFAQKYSDSDLFDEEKREMFIGEIMKWDGLFHGDQVGIDFQSGLTYDGCPVDWETGDVLSQRLHTWSAASKESLHINMVTLYLTGNRYAQNWFSLYSVF